MAGAFIERGASKAPTAKPPVYKGTADRPQPTKPAPYTGVMGPENSFETRAAANGRANQLVTNTLGAPTTDPFNGMTEADYLAMLYGSQNRGSSGGGGGGGGGGAGRPGDPDPLGWNSIAQQQGMEASYAQMLAALDAKNKTIQGGYDSQYATLGTQRDQGAARTAALIAEQQAAANATRGTVAQAYQGGDANLAKLQADYTAMAQARVQPANQTLQAFGADPGAVSDVSGVQDALMAQRAMQSRLGTADDVLYANRGNVYNGLNSDVAQSREAGYSQLTQQLAQQRQVAEQEAAMERAQLQMQQQQAILQLQAQEQARKAQYV